MLRVLIVGQLGELPSGPEPFQQPLLRTFVRYVLRNESEFDNYMGAMSLRPGKEMRPLPTHSTTPPYTSPGRCQ